PPSRLIQSPHSPPSFSLHSSRTRPHLHPFPTRRSSDLHPQPHRSHFARRSERRPHLRPPRRRTRRPRLLFPQHKCRHQRADSGPDRKSTRLNSSHLGISYAVFCLKKKKKISSRNDVTLT